MTRMEWGERPREYSIGVDRGVLYLDSTGVPWNGLVSVEETDTGTLNGDFYFEGVLVHISEVTGDFKAKVSAFTYPERFDAFNGNNDQNTYERFDLCYRTQKADTYQIHLVYRSCVIPNDPSYHTVTDNADLSLFQWDIYSEHVANPGGSPSSHFIVESSHVEALAIVEDILYGTDTTDPRMPSPQELYEIYESFAILKVTYLGDGIYSVSGPDDMVQVNEDGTFIVDAPSAFTLDEGIIKISSY